MDKPIVFDNKPIAVELESGNEYHFCSCGRSANQPFCDGSHVGTGFTPMTFMAEESGEAYLCACKWRGDPHYYEGVAHPHRFRESAGTGRRWDSARK